jgi:hypothetical protein
MINGDPQRIELDVDQVFMLYAAFCGDVAKTAHSSGIPMQEVEKLALDHGWPDRIRSLVTLTKGTKPGDVERGINRAINFVQAHRCRLFIEGVMRALERECVSDKAALDQFTTERINKHGEVCERQFSARAIADLASAMEKIHWMTYTALNDSPQERAKRVEKASDDTAQSDVHARIAAALAEMRNKSPLAQLEAAQATLAQQAGAAQHQQASNVQQSVVMVEAHIASAAQGAALEGHLPPTA